MLEMFFGSRAEKLSVQWMCFLDRTDQDRASETEVRKLPEGTVVSELEKEKKEVEEEVETFEEVVAQKEVPVPVVAEEVDDGGFVVVPECDLSEDEFQKL